jgi:hypothetical protein
MVVDITLGMAKTHDDTRIVNLASRRFTVSVTDTLVGDTVQGTVAIVRFVNSAGQLTAVGLLNAVVAGACDVPTTVIALFATPVTITQATSSVLHLNLGAVDVVGLQVHLNEMVIDVTAHGGSHRLGHLLRGIAELVDSPGGLALLLNQIVGVRG